MQPCIEPSSPAAATEFEELAVGERVTLLCRLEALDETATLFAVNGCRLRDG